MVTISNDQVVVPTDSVIPKTRVLKIACGLRTADCGLRRVEKVDRWTGRAYDGRAPLFYCGT